MDRYYIWIVTPPEYTHSRAFQDVADSLRAAFIELGHGCKIQDYPPLVQTRNVIVLGANIEFDRYFFGKGWIIYNLEQIQEGSPWLTSSYLNLLKTHPVWDYSLSNIEKLTQMGVESLSHVPVGYTPCLTKVECLAAPDIDILHIGSMNERRAKLLQDLSSSGVKVHHAFDCYGLQRDILIARSKIILNIHYYEAKVFEIVRCSYMLANRKAVVSEVGLDEALEWPFREGIDFCSYDDLVSRCLHLLEHEEERADLARRGFDLFTKMKQTDYLKRVL